jgi:hypothetical protein
MGKARAPSRQPSATSTTGSSLSVAVKRTFGVSSGRIVEERCVLPTTWVSRALICYESGGMERLLAYSFVLRKCVERNHSETYAGCIVSRTSPTRSSLNASRSVSSRSLAEKVSRVFLASYLLR